MRALLINGSPNQHGCTFTALNEIAKTLRQEGVESEFLYLGRKPIAGCIACLSCQKTGHCFMDDIVCKTQAMLPDFDAIVVGSPVYYAAPTGQLVSFLNRLFFSAGSMMSGKIGAAVVSCRRGGASAAFDQINKYFTISNMPIAPSQYWNQVHGFTPEDVMKDAEGLQTMRTLAENIAWLLKCISAGKKSGVSQPVYETRIRTHFIQ